MKTHKTTRLLASACVCAGLGAGALGQQGLTNPGFENADPFFPFFPEGWADIPPLAPRWRELGDDPFNPPLVRTGSRSIELPTVSGERFLAWTTNVFDSQGQLYDPSYVYGAGDVVVSGYYAIPASDPLVNAIAGLKLEFRRTPPNFSIYLSFEDLSITGHTNSQWQYFEMRVTNQDFCDRNLAWGGPWPPFPTSVSVLPVRFLPPEFDPSDQSGTIFWDDLQLVQLTDCVADLTGSLDPNNPAFGVPDGLVDTQDFFFYVTQFASGLPASDLSGSTDPGSSAYGNCDGSVDSTDFFYFLDQFNTPCGG